MNFSYCADPFDRDDWRELLARAVDRFKTNWNDVNDALANGNATLWIAETHKAVAAMICRRDGDVMEVWLAGGAVLSGCVPFLERVEREAVMFGMTTGRLTGRKGWARVLAPWGWREDGDNLVKDFVHG